MFCVRCGREGPTYESLCADCFLRLNRFTSAPEHVDLPECAHCGEYLIEGKWLTFPAVEDAAEQAAVRSIVIGKGARLERAEVAVRREDGKNFAVHIDAELLYADLKAREEQDTTVRVKGAVCQRCSKMKGSYYESILQVRSRGRKLDEDEKEAILGEVESRVEAAARRSRDAFISKVEEVHGGLDVYLSSNMLGKSLSRELADEYGAEVKESSSLLGQKDGKEVFRVTYLVRLPSYRIGDVIVTADRPYLICRIGSKGTRLVDLQTHDQMNVHNVDLREATVVGSSKDALDAVVLTETDKEIQMMDPRNFKPVEVKKAAAFRRRGDTVKVFLYGGELLLLPHWCQ